MNAPGGKAEQPGDLRAAALYMLVSILLILFNKATLSYYRFGAPNVLTLSQNVCSVLFLIACRRAQIIEFHAFSMRNLRKMVPLGLTFILYMVLGMIAMKVVNIPMYTTLRRTTVIFVMALEWIVSRKSSTLSVKLAVGLMLSGALLAGAHDLNFDLLAYFIVLLYNVATAGYLVLVNNISAKEKQLPQQQQMKSWDMMYYNNLISIPLLVVIILVSGELSAAWETPYWHDAGFLIALAMSSFLAFILNYSIFWNTAVNSALTQTVSGQAKDIVVVILGFMLFADAHFETRNVLGITLGFGGSIFYAASKIVPSCTAEYWLARYGLVRLAGTAEGEKKKHELAGSAGLPFTQERAPLLGQHAGRNSGGGGSGGGQEPKRQFEEIAGPQGGVHGGAYVYPPSTHHAIGPPHIVHVTPAHGSASGNHSVGEGSIVPSNRAFLPPVHAQGLPSPVPSSAASSPVQEPQSALQTRTHHAHTMPHDQARPYARHDTHASHPSFGGGSSGGAGGGFTSPLKAHGPHGFQMHAQHVQPARAAGSQA